MDNIGVDITMNNIKVVPNFHFRGNAKQAIELYQKAFSAEVKVLMCDPDSENDLVWHAEIYIGNQRMTMTDDLEMLAPNAHPMSLLLSFEQDEDVQKAFAVLADGATIIYPIQATEYSTCFVKLIDKFGMLWVLLTE